MVFAQTRVLNDVALHSTCYLQHSLMQMPFVALLHLVLGKVDMVCRFELSMTEIGQVITITTVFSGENSNGGNVNPDTR
jgi:hypothetical protein